VAVAAVAAAYFGASQLGFPLSVNDSVFTIWPASGIGLAALLIGGTWLWPALLIGEFATRLAHGSAVPVSLTLGVGDMLESLVAVMLLARVGFDRRLNRTRDVLALFALGALAPTMIAATIGTLGLAIGGSLAWSSFWSNWHLWWLGDATGVIVIAPLALVFVPGGWRWVRGLPWPGWWKGLEVAVWLAALVTIVLVAVGLPLPFATLIFPTLAWGALRFGKRGATLATAVTGIATVLILKGDHDMVSGVSIDSELLFAQSFLLVVGTTTLALAVSTEETRRTMRQLRVGEMEATALANEHASLGTVATAVARQTSPTEMFELVSAEAAKLLDQPEVVVIRGTPADQARVLGGWRSDGSEPNALAAPPGGGLSVPIVVEGGEWGRLCAPALDPATDPAQAHRAAATLSRLAGLLGLAIGNAEGRQQLLHQASTDPLTGLANHRAFHERLAEEMARCRRYDRPISVAMLDVDNFKEINDTAGHLVGDTTLAAIAHRIVNVMRADALVARVGGDEIGVILPECDTATAERAIERARQAVCEQPIGDVGTLTVSAGLCDHVHATTSSRILHLADQALYQAKSRGRDACVCYSPAVVATSLKN
jgi:diguanylate cyclase (GGDEF)-like protein